MKFVKNTLLLISVVFASFLMIDWFFGLYVCNKNSSFIHLKNYLVEEDTQPLYQPQAFLNYINYPNNKNFQINNAGLRSTAEYEIPKPENTLRVLFLGGSTTFGEVENIEDSFPFLIEKKLSEKFPDKNFECLNAGMGAATSAEILTHFIFKYQYFKPDIVVIHCGINDAFAYPPFESYTYQPDYSTSKRPMKEVYRPDNFVKMLSHSNVLAFTVIKLFLSDFLEGDFTKNEFFYYHNENIWLKNHYDYLDDFEINAFYQNISNLITLLKEKKKKIILMDEQVYYDKVPEGIRVIIEGGVEKNNAFLEKIADEHNIKFIKFSGLSLDESYFLGNDGIHVNEKGELLKAEMIFTEILKFIDI